MSEKTRWIVLVGLNLFVVLSLVGLIYLQGQKLDERRQEAAVLRTKIDESRELIKKTPGLVKNVIVQRETDAMIKEILSDDEDINNFVRTLREFEEASGISISQIKQQKITTNNRTKEDFTRVGYTLTFEGTGFQLLDFLDLVESHPRFMSVTQFKLTGARRGKFEKDAEIPRHKVQLDLETYVYQAQTGSKEVRIDGYARKRDLLISEVAKHRTDLRVPVYDYRGARGRRDPWVDPRIPRSLDANQPQLTIEEQNAIVDELEQLAEAARAVWQRAEQADNLIEEMKARAELDDRLVALDEEVRRIEADRVLIFIPAHRRFEKNVVQVIDGLRDEAASTENTPGPSIAELRESAEAMARNIEAGEYELALDAFAAIETRLAMADTNEYKQPLVRDLRNLHLLASTVIEFEKIEIRITGIALYEDRRPVALINGTSVGEGEILGDELLVRKIGIDQVEFGYRGMVLARRVESVFGAGVQ